MIRSLTALLAAAFLSACAPALVLNVNTTSDEQDANPGDGQCINQGAPGFCSLRAAVQEANARPPSSNTLIHIQSSGIYALGPGDRTGHGLVIGPEFKLITIEGCCATPESTTIEPADGVIQRLFTIDRGAVIMRNLRLTGGRTPGGAADAPPEKDGGAILLRGVASRLSLEHVVVESNIAGRQGGGIWTSDDVELLLLVSDSIIRGNTASNAGVGGAGGIHSGAQTSVSRTLIEANTGNSGGMRLYRSGVGQPAHEITRSTFHENITSNNGGGIRIDTPDGETVIAFSTFSGNQSASEFGSAPAIQVAQGTLQLRSSTISENNFSFSPPALVVSSGATAVLSSTIIAQNDALGDDQPNVACGTEAGLILNGFNLIDGIDGSCPFTDPDPNSPDLTGPLDAQLDFYETSPIGHYPLDSDSLGLDAGLFICDGTDQLGTSRPQDGDGDGLARCDIGAIEQPAG